MVIKQVPCLVKEILTILIMRLNGVQALWSYSYPYRGLHPLPTITTSVLAQVIIGLTVRFRAKNLQQSLYVGESKVQLHRL